MKIQDFQRKKRNDSKITVVTCYDYPSARTVAESSVDCVLVGDSVAMAVHGHATTVTATMDMMALHTQAVALGLGPQFLICDLPFLSHNASQPQCIDNVKRLFQAGAQAVKIEGASAQTYQTIDYLSNAGIPVMGHIGLTLQFVHQLGGPRVQGKNQAQADKLLQQALSLEEAGCFAVVIECVPCEVAKTITQALRIPTIGIGAGWETDGQVLVWHDMLGLQTSFNPKFIKRFAAGHAVFVQALNDYVHQVQTGIFPAQAHVYESVS